MLLPEIVFGIVVGSIVIVALVVYGWRQRGAQPQPSTLSDTALIRRLEAVSVWLSKYYKLPEAKQQTERIQRAFAIKRRYVKRLKNELAMRQMAAVVKAFHPDASSVDQRAVELESEGHSKRMARTMAQLEWGLQGLLARHLQGEALHDHGDTAKMVLRAAELVTAGKSESAAIALALKEWSARAQ
jgi:hypothetical protein